MSYHVWADPLFATFCLAIAIFLFNYKPRPKNSQNLAARNMVASGAFSKYPNIIRK